MGARWVSTTRANTSASTCAALARNKLRTGVGGGARRQDIVGQDHAAALMSALRSRLPEGALRIAGPL